MDEARRELTELEKNLRVIEFTATQKGQAITSRNESPRSFLNQDMSYRPLWNQDMYQTEKIPFRFRDVARGSELDETQNPGRYDASALD
jgi:C4-dicarboxylate-specific signal transduction histidine kinase